MFVLVTKCNNAWLLETKILFICPGKNSSITTRMLRALVTTVSTCFVLLKSISWILFLSRFSLMYREQYMIDDR